MFSIHKSTYTQPERIPSWDRAYVSEAGRQAGSTGLESAARLLCGVLAAVEDTHGTEQMAV